MHDMSSDIEILPLVKNPSFQVGSKIDVYDQDCLLWSIGIVMEILDNQIKIHFLGSDRDCRLFDKGSGDLAALHCHTTPITSLHPPPLIPYSMHCGLPVLHQRSGRIFLPSGNGVWQYDLRTNESTRVFYKSITTLALDEKNELLYVMNPFFSRLCVMNLKNDEFEVLHYGSPGRFMDNNHWTFVQDADSCRDVLHLVDSSHHHYFNPNKHCFLYFERSDTSAYRTIEAVVARCPRTNLLLTLERRKRGDSELEWYEYDTSIRDSRKAI